MTAIAPPKLHRYSARFTGRLPLPVPWSTSRGGSAPRRARYQRASDSVGPLLAGSDADGLFDRHHEDFAVADFVRARGVHDGLHGALDKDVVEHDLDLDLGQEVDHVLCPAIDLGVSLLPPEALHLGDG